MVITKRAADALYVAWPQGVALCNEEAEKDTDSTAVISPPFHSPLRLSCAVIKQSRCPFDAADKHRLLRDTFHDDRLYFAVVIAVSKGAEVYCYEAARSIESEKAMGRTKTWRKGGKGKVKRETERSVLRYRS